MSNSVKTVGDADFKTKVKDSSKPVLVSFWANWSAPSKMIMPTLETIASECPGVEIYKLDTDQNTSVMTEQNVTSLPTLLMFKKGDLVDKVIGAATKATIKNMVERAIAGGSA